MFFINAAPVEAHGCTDTMTLTLNEIAHITDNKQVFISVNGFSI